MKYIVHILAAALILGSLGLAHVAPGWYDALMQEDRAVEWGTAVLFFVAAIARLYAAAGTRRTFDGLVGLFCFFVAGEEISWGQRLLGFTPAAVFLEYNTQQEANVHNFAGVFGHPKWILMIALAGYGLLLPAAGRTPTTHRLLDRLGATAPPASLAPWFLVAIVLLVWYPVTFTGEWVELLAGGLFVATAPRLKPGTAALIFGATVPVSVALTWLSDIRSPGDSVAVSCARSELAALVDDITRGGAATTALAEMASIHKRVWSSIAAGYLDGSSLMRFRTASCAGGPSAEAITARRRYAVDPWGTAYWLDVRPSDVDSDARRVVAYSFGPNRHRDGEPGEGEGDDVYAEGILR
jgi:hypothetical protein